MCRYLPRIKINVSIYLNKPIKDFKVQYFNKMLYFVKKRSKDSSLTCPVVYSLKTQTYKF